MKRIVKNTITIVSDLKKKLIKVSTRQCNFEISAYIIKKIKLVCVYLNTYIKVV